jgi:hypothetical protein
LWTVFGGTPGRRPWRLSASLLLAILLAALAPGTTRAAGIPVAQRPAEVRQYWTAQRMAGAVPLAGPPAPAAAFPGLAGRDGPPSYVPPAAPGQATPVARLRRGAVDSAAAQRSAVDASADSSAFPRRVHGKVFLTLGGTDYICSATVVDSAAHTVVWTAGHCLNGAGIGLGFASNWTFVPG